MRRSLVSFTDNFSVLAGPHDAIVSAPAPKEHVLQVVEVLSRIADVLVLDLGFGHDDLYFECLTRASQIVLVGEQSIASIRALKMVRAMLDREACGEFVVVNRYDARRAGFTIEQLRKPLEVARLYTVSSDCPALSAAADNGRPLRLQEPVSRPLSDIDDLSHILVPGADRRGSREDGRGFLGRLRRTLIGT